MGSRRLIAPLLGSLVVVALIVVLVGLVVRAGDPDSGAQRPTASGTVDGATSTDPPAPSTTDSRATTTSAPATTSDTTNQPTVSRYDPVSEGEPLPEGYRPLLPRDAIRPVYEPTFVAATAVDWTDRTLVIGVEIDGEARAYPVSYLNHREMVIDRLSGIPILVTW
jgi:hypothetical protein